MFAIADLIVLDAIEDGLRNLRENPAHLEFILGKYTDTPYMRKLHGSAFVRQCVDFVTKNKITIKPYYVFDLAKLPSISVIAQYQEDMQVLGDYGAGQDVGELDPVRIGQVLPVEWGTESNELIIGNANEAIEWLYSGAYLSQDDFSTRINLVIPKEHDRAVLVCDDPLPQIRLCDWVVTSAPARRVAILNASGNHATVSVDVKSSGDIETHKLLATVVRYCLKRGRLLMDSNGLQVSSSGQNFPVAYDEEQGIFQTVFTLSGKIWDCWIESEMNNQVPGLTVCAVPPKVTAGEQIVEFDL